MSLICPASSHSHPWGLMGHCETQKALVLHFSSVSLSLLLCFCPPQACVVPVTLHSWLHPWLYASCLWVLFRPSLRVCFGTILPASALISCALSLFLLYIGVLSTAASLSSNDWIGHGLLTLSFACKFSCKHWCHHIKLAGQSGLAQLILPMCARSTGLLLFRSKLSHT